MWFFKKREKRILGVDIGFYSIKVAELVQRGKGFLLSNYGEVVIRRPVPEERFLEARKNAFFFASKTIIEALSQLLKTGEIQEKKVVFSLPDLVTFITSLEVERMEEDLRKTVISEARKYLPLPASQMMIDFSTTPMDGTLSILLFATPKETIAPYQQIANGLSLQVLGFLPEVFALVASLIPARETKNFLILDIGEKSTTLNITKGPVLKDSRSVEVASFHFTEAVAEAFNSSFSEAEVLKLKYGILGGDPEGEKIKQAISPFISLIIKEVERLLFDKKIDRILLSGGGANMAGLVEYLKNYFRIEVEKGNPFWDISFHPELKDILPTLGPSFAISLGLAKKGFELL